MSMTWGELKSQLVDLGFEEDTITSEEEYGRLMRNSVNRAVSIITATVIPLIEGYLKNVAQWGYETEEEYEDRYGDTVTRTVWQFPKTRKITSDTSDDTKINFPDILEPLVPLLAAHYIWLDDDLTKAMIYWNEYDDLKDQIITNCQRPRRVEIVGGI